MATKTKNKKAAEEYDNYVKKYGKPFIYVRSNNVRDRAKEAEIKKSLGIPH
jgi:hypothetical protein